jgi:arsenical-resistance protein 2
MQSLVLTEGIKGWVDAGAEYIALMDEYEKEVWEKKV